MLQNEENGGFLKNSKQHMNNEFLFLRYISVEKYTTDFHYV